MLHFEYNQSIPVSSLSSDFSPYSLFSISSFLLKFFSGVLSHSETSLFPRRVGCSSGWLSWLFLSHWLAWATYVVLYYDLPICKEVPTSGIFSRWPCQGPTRAGPRSSPLPCWVHLLGQLPLARCTTVSQATQMLLKHWRHAAAWASLTGTFSACSYQTAGFSHLLRVFACFINYSTIILWKPDTPIFGICDRFLLSRLADDISFSLLHIYLSCSKCFCLCIHMNTYALRVHSF